MPPEFTYPGRGKEWGIAGWTQSDDITPENWNDVEKGDPLPTDEELYNAVHLTAYWVDANDERHYVTLHSPIGWDWDQLESEVEIAFDSGEY